MKILYIHQYFETPSTAGGTRSYEMARRLVAMGHEVDLITSDRTAAAGAAARTTIVAGIRVHWIPVAYSNKMGFLRRMMSFIIFALRASLAGIRLRSDLIYATSTPLTVCIPAVAVRWFRGTRIVFEVRDLWPAVPIAMGILRGRISIGLARWLERFAYGHSARVVALAPGMREGVISTGYDERRVHVIPNGADLDVFGAPNDQHNNSEFSPDSTLAFGGKEQLIVYAGTLGLANGAAYIVRLAHAIMIAAPDCRIHFAVIGEGKERAAIEALAQELGVHGERVRFLGSMPKVQVALWLQRSSATIMTYDGPSIVYRDSVSNKFFDSLAAGRLVLANFIGFSTAIAAREGAGMILSRNDLHAAASAIISLFCNPDRMRQMNQRAMQVGITLFHRDELAKDLNRVLVDAKRSPQSPRVFGVGIRYIKLWNDILRAGQA